jgi:site-specific recombinase XerD
MKISEFESRYLAFLEATRSKAYVRDNRVAFAWLKKTVGDIPLVELKVSNLEPIFATEFGRASHNAARIFRTLKAAFSKSVAWNESAENPFTKFKLPRIPETSIPFLKNTDLEKLLNQNIAEDLKLLFEFAFYTGLRQGEILNLRWDSVNVPELTITVSNTDDFTTKSKRERIIPINRNLLDVLNRIRKMNNNMATQKYVFQRRNGNYVARQFKKSVRLAGLDEHLHFHCLRHSFASNLIRAGVNPVHVKQLMGHSNLATTLKYTHVDIDDLRGAVSKLD